MKTLLRFFRGNPPPALPENEEKEPAGGDIIIGQTKILRELTPLLSSAAKTKSPLPHLLLVGSEGSGRKTLALWLARKTKRQTHLLAGAKLSSVDELILSLAKIQEGDCLILENPEKIPYAVALALAQIAKNFALKFPHPKTGQITNWQMPRFTLIGLTSADAMLAAALRAALPQVYYFEPYSTVESAQIIHNWGRISFPAAQKLATLTGGRLTLCREIYLSFFEAHPETSAKITPEQLDKLTAALELDKNYLTKDERSVLEYLICSGTAVPEEKLHFALNFTQFAAEKIKHLLTEGFIFETSAGWQTTLKARIRFQRPQPYEERIAQLLQPSQRAEATAKLLAAGTNCIPSLLRCLAEPDLKTRNAISAVLCALGEEALPFLAKTLQAAETPPRDRVVLLQLVSESKSPAALALLQKIAGEEHPLRLTAIKCLGQSENVKIIPFLIRLIKKEKEPVQLAAVAALKQLHRQESIEPLQKILKNVPFTVQKAILGVLGEVGDNRVANLIRKENGRLENGSV